jgi:deltex
MEWSYYPKGTMPLETYEDIGTWFIYYEFHDGIRNGVKYRGTRRNAYLPDTKEGREVVFLLIKAFKRKVTFTVGDSVTTGRKNVVVWNSVHHKTHTHGGLMCYGYPDPTYFNRVKLELADKGVILEEEEDPENLPKKGNIKI